MGCLPRRDAAELATGPADKPGRGRAIHRVARQSDTLHHGGPWSVPTHDRRQREGYWRAAPNQEGRGARRDYLGRTLIAVGLRVLGLACVSARCITHTTNRVP